MRAADLSSDRRKLLVPVPGRGNIKALLPPPALRELDVQQIMQSLLAAEKALAGLTAVANLLPQPDLIARSLQRREAVLSSQIVGTRTDLTQLFEHEATGSDVGLPDDAAVTLDLIRALHRVLLDGSDYPYPEGPGQWRRGQNWIGGRRIEDAIVVPPPVSHLEACLLDLEQFLQVERESPAIMALPLRLAVAHAQFESIHPFSDGNGRVGRLLPPLMLAAEGMPPLYLAGYLKARQRDYYEALAGVQLRGRWTPWLAFVLDGIAAAAAMEQATAQALLNIRQDWERRTATMRADAAARRLLDVFIGSPVQTVASARDALGVSLQAANAGIAALLERDIVREVTGRRWGRSFHAHEVLAVLESRPELP